jgi:2-polyprenyl-3-methyl-5-hydroxy-6-metoxy-1,4-benzoquinol methylase/glycosyltransferase involved in cell wall biosynthesis
VNGTAVGVVVPNKNGAAFLRDALESVLSQDYPNIQCVVMDAESTDESLSILDEYDGRIRWYSKADTCAAEAINRGWQLLDAPILAWLNSDDMWAPSAVRRVVEAFDGNPEADVVSGECPLIDELGNVIDFRPTGPFDLTRSVAEADHILNQPAVFMKRSALESIGWLRETWLHDHDLWLRLGLGAKFVHVDDVLAFGRKRHENLGNDADLVGPTRVRILEDFLSSDDVPTELRALRPRALSWAHLRAAHAYLTGNASRVEGARHVGLALRADPRNIEIPRAVVRWTARGLKNAAKTVLGASTGRNLSDQQLDRVRDYWNERPCNVRHSPKPVGSLEYFNEVEERKYRVEPHIPGFAEFARWEGRDVLEIGCGIGTDTMNFARNGARVTAVELSERSMELAQQRARVLGLDDRIEFINGNAEELSDLVPRRQYDLIYSFGVIHHTPHPDRVFNQIAMVSAPGTVVKMMMYYLFSWKVAAIFLRYGKGRIWRLPSLVAEYSEAQTGSPVTFTYTKRGLRRLLRRHGFRVEDMFVDHIFPYRIPDYVDYRYVKNWYFRIMPGRLFRWLERHFGWHLCVTAVREASAR